MSHPVQRGILYPTAPQIPNDIREKIIEGRWWSGSRLFIYEIVSSTSPSNYYVVSFSLFERFLNALSKIILKDYFGNKIKGITQATTVRFIDHAELRRLAAQSPSAISPPAPAAPKSSSPSQVDDKVKTSTAAESTKIDPVPAPATQPPSRNERVVRYLPFNKWPLTEIDQRAFNIIYQRLIDPDCELVLKSCSETEKHDFVFVNMVGGRDIEYFDDIRSMCWQGGIVSNQDFYLVSSEYSIDPNDFPIEKEYFSVCLAKKRKSRFWQPEQPIIDWESSSLEVQRQAALLLLRIFKFSIQWIQSIPVLPEGKQTLAYTVIGSGKGFSKIDEENIYRLSQRILGFAVKVERSERVHFMIAKVEDARREAKDQLYLGLSPNLVATTVQVNISHFAYDREWTKKVNLCKPGSGENFVDWDDPESVRQVAMFFLRIYQVSLVSFGAQKAIA